jgi:hypothetical protein
MTLQHTEVNETGQYFAGLLLSPFLKIGDTLANFQSSGVWPLSLFSGHT